MRPYWVAKSFNNAASGNVTLAPPATVTDDILLCVITARDNVACTFPVGWTILHELNNGIASRCTIAWKRCVGAEAAFAVTHPAGSNIHGLLEVYRSAKPTGSPFGDTGIQANATSTTCTAPSITTTDPESLLIFVSQYANSGSGGFMSLETSEHYGYMWERDEDGSSGLAGACVANVAVPTASDSGLSTGIYTNTRANIGANLELLPDPAGAAPATPAGASTGYGPFGVANVLRSTNANRMTLVAIITGGPGGVPVEPHEVIWGSNGNDAVPAAGTPMVQQGPARV